MPRTFSSCCNFVKRIQDDYNGRITDKSGMPLDQSVLSRGIFPERERDSYNKLSSKFIIVVLIILRFSISNERERRTFLSFPQSFCPPSPVSPFVLEQSYNTR